MLVIGGSEIAFYKQITDFRGQFQRIASGDDDVGDFACLECAETVGQAKNLRRVEGDGFQAFVVGEAVGDRIGGVLAETPRSGVIKAAKGNFDTGSGQLPWLS